jgi:hypothetical protein
MGSCINKIRLYLLTKINPEARDVLGLITNIFLISAQGVQGVLID